MKYLIIILLLTSCNLGMDDYTYSVQPELLPYVETFYKEAEQRGVTILKENLTVVIRPVSSSGLAVHDANGNRIVYINPDSFYANSDILENQREYLIFHELAHALLNRRHVKTYSIMNYDKAGEILSDYSTGSREELLNELFHD